MIKLFVIAASAVATIVGAPAIARERGAATAPTEQQPPTPSADKHVRYCVIDTVTGSRIPQRKCLSRAEWIMEGFDPLHPEQ